jgi:hypothetical protein
VGQGGVAGDYVVHRKIEDQRLEDWKIEDWRSDDVAVQSSIFIL